MLCEDYTTNLLDMEHMEIKTCEKSCDEIVLHVQMKRRGEYCPKCGAYTEAVHDYREQTVKDCPVQGKALIWKYRKRRYRCQCCGKRFYEKNWLLPKWHRITNRLALMAIQKLSEKVSRKDIAKGLGVSESTICRWMNLTEYGKPGKLPAVLSIDEFRGNAGGEKFQAVFVGIGFYLRSVNKQRIKAHFSHFRELFNELIKQLLRAAAHIVFEKPCYRRMVRRLPVLQQPYEPDIRFARFLYPSARIDAPHIGVYDDRKQNLRSKLPPLPSIARSELSVVEFTQYLRHLEHRIVRIDHYRNI